MEWMARRTFLFCSWSLWLHVPWTLAVSCATRISHVMTTPLMCFPASALQTQYTHCLEQRPEKVRELVTFWSGVISQVAPLQPGVLHLDAP